MESQRKKKTKKIGKLKLRDVTLVPKVDLERVYNEKIKHLSPEDRSYNLFLLNKEKLEFDELKDENEYEYLYPNYNDPNFNIKIAEKKEFYDTQYDGTIRNITEYADVMCNVPFELAPHQLFVRNFLSFQTPYNSLLLYHGLGTGKTCSAISISEEMRDYLKQMGISKKIIIIAAPNVQDEFKRQLFDETKLKEISGLWNIRACTGNNFLHEINPMNMKGLSKKKVVSQIRRIIHQSYIFVGYTEFANTITKIIKQYDTIKDPKVRKQQVVNSLKKEFSNRLIVIDEVHNLRITDDNPNKRTVKNLLTLVKHADNLRLLLLSATPMFNSYREIIWLLNLMNINDGRAEITIKDIFDKDGNFKIDARGKDIGRELLIRKATGYISFVRGDNPYMFPFRIFPGLFQPEKTFRDIPYPENQINGKPIAQGIQYVEVYNTVIASYQNIGYNYIIEKIRAKLPKAKDIEVGLGYNILEPPLQALNMVYPTDKLTEDTDLSSIKFDVKELIGKAGLKRIMKFSTSTKNNFEYKPSAFKKYGRIFSPESLLNYSGKISSICDSVSQSRGIILIFSQYIDGGCIPLALALEEMGFSRHPDYGHSLFKDPPTEAIDALSMQPKSRVSGKFHPARYAMITGDSALSPNNAGEVKLLTQDNNRNGEIIKVVIISKAGSEGIDLKNIRQIHIMEPWYNMNRIEQIIGRGVRICSHKELPLKDRNVEIYLYATILPGDATESADLYVYRLAEQKAVQIGIVSRVLKETAIDCILNKGQQNFTVEKMHQTIKQDLSSGKEINYDVGDRPFSALCDYMDSCSYTCDPTKDISPDDINEDTFTEAFIITNTSRIMQRIRDLMKERYVYKKSDLIREINVTRPYPVAQIYAALTQLINDKNEYITDMLERDGHLVNIGNYYMFQPIELDNPHISMFDRVTPIDYKHELIDFELPERMEEIKIKSIKSKKKGKEINISKLIEELEEKFELTNRPQKLNPGEKNWYKFCSLTIDKLLRKGIPRGLINKFIVDHLIDMLNFPVRFALASYLYQKKSVTSFEYSLKAHFDSKILTAKGIHALPMQNISKLELFILNKGELTPAKPEDIKDLEHQLNKLIIPIEEISNIIGFIISFKKDFMVFKTKNLAAVKSNPGTRCDQSAKRTVIETLNNIVIDEEYTLDNMDQINAIQLCSELEFYLRYYDYIKKNGEKWFFSPEEAGINKASKLWKGI